MKSMARIILITIIVAMNFSCGSGDQARESGDQVTATPAAATDTAKEKPFENVQFASKYDTSCGMPLSAGVEDTLHVNDKVYGFFSKECKEDFINKLKAQKK
jgi:hypothetical protein